MEKPPKKKTKMVGLKSKITSQWYKGNLCPIRNPNAYFINPAMPLPEGYAKKDVFMHPDNISRFLLPLKVGDEVEFILGDRDKAKPMARKVRVTKYRHRTSEDLVLYIDKFLQLLQSTDRSKVLIETLPSTAMWSVLSSPTVTENIGSAAYVEVLLSLLSQILVLGKPYKTLLNEMMKTSLKGTLFQSTSNKSLSAMIKSSVHLTNHDQYYYADSQTYISVQLVQSFCQDIVRQVPQVSRCLLPTILAMSEKTPTSRTQHFLYDLLSMNLACENSLVSDVNVWQELPLIPSNEELSGNLVEKDKHLSPVKKNSCYESAGEYMDTYFRLLRAETFSSIQHGIKQLKACELDERDMNVYYNVHLAGFQIQNSRFSLAIHFTPAKKVKKWEASPQLMYGNLVCISLNRRFDDVIWATISNRDSDLLNQHQIIMVQLIDEYIKCMSEIISSLQVHAGTAVMVESPTYYHAFKPVLSSLKEFDIENFPLQQEIVQVRSKPELPVYLQNAETLDTSAVCPHHVKSEIDHELRKENSGEMEVKRFLEIFNSNVRTSLEASQCEALIHALKSRLAIIQGPPGCGKTFIGVKIVQLLLSLSPKLNKPILLLTYKNHALDEFLKQMLEFCDENDLVRIGGRSREPELEFCNVQTIMSNVRHTKVQFVEIQETRREIEEIEQKIKDKAGVVERSCHLTRKSFIEELSEDQTQSLLLEAACWKKKQLPGIRNLIFGIAKDFVSLKQFLLMYMQSQVPKNRPDTVRCYKLFEEALRAWFPDRGELRRMKQFQVEFVLQIRSVEAQASKEGASNDHNDDEDDGDYDEEYIKNLLETRTTSLGKQAGATTEGLALFTYDKTKNKDILIEVSDYPDDMSVSPQIRSIKNIWNLNEIERMQFLYCILNEKASSVSEEFDDLLTKLEELKNRKQELEMQQKVEVLSEKKIIGVTITGASIHHDILHQIGPSVVIVEEAAEILEPSLLAALTPAIEHLILIGDHKQLRPQVDTYELCKSFDFDVSMMERLINTGFPFKTLNKQNRMRPEFSALLHDIYPCLEDNLPLVQKNESLECIEKSMYFWSHEDPEHKDRTFTNTKEAERIVSLVLYLLVNDCSPSDITVLAAYLGQTKLLRSMLKKEKAKRPKLFQEKNSDESTEGFVRVQTIDMFQGDENRYVLVSLVRSNPHGGIGFLKDVNRRCVAQSRAKCGMYFVGNMHTLVHPKQSCWHHLIHEMTREGCVGSAIPLQCSKHKKLSRCLAVDAQNITEIVYKPTTLCKQLCGDQLPCEIPDHLCKKPCFPRHSHHRCSTVVLEQFQSCGHDVERKCYENILDLRCNVDVMVYLPCGHLDVKKCHIKTSDLRCEVMVTVILPDCGHQASKKCCVETSRVVCQTMVDVTLPRCGHEAKKKCHEKLEHIFCSQPCREMNTCGEHGCPYLCGKPHDHNNCQRMIDYKFPDCGHPSPKKKKCSEIINWKCSAKVYFKSNCGHDIQKQCHQKNGEVKCPFKPCGKLRKCGHPCKSTCGEDCEKGDCQHCEDIFKEKLKEFRARANQRVKELEEKITKKEVPSFSIDEIRKDGAEAAEYQKVNDLVVKFIQPCHNWYPTVTKIEKVTNLILEKKFEVSKSKAFGDHIDTKFHGTSNEAVKGITENGFKMPDQNPSPGKRGMYGQGIYFATDSSKSAQQIYTKGSQKLLLCQVILGKTKTVNQPNYTLTKQKLRSQGYDSVYAPRGTAVKNDEFVIFDPDQALPQYIIHFCAANGMPSPPTPPSSTNFFVKKMTATRTVDFNDPFEMHFRYAESHYRRMSTKGSPPLTPQQATISSIDVVINKVLEDKFEKKKQSFKHSGIPDNEILAYHGTNSASIDSILKNNLQLTYAKRQAYGRGNYFSEFPSISMGYGDGLVLCRILPGKEFVNSSNTNIPQGYNSKKVLLQQQTSGAGGANASGEMIIIENSDQILPYFVIHR